jgi:hypothetical protein
MGGHVLKVWYAFMKDILTAGGLPALYDIYILKDPWVATC